MTQRMLHKAAELAQKVGHVFVATADTAGTPHVAAAARLTVGARGRAVVEAWFCPGTVVNLDRNKHVALVVWDAAADNGYQLVGHVEKVDELAVLDGYTPQVERGKPLPQVERRLTVRVKSVLVFTRAPHTDQAADSARTGRGAAQ